MIASHRYKELVRMKLEDGLRLPVVASSCSTGMPKLSFDSNFMSSMAGASSVDPSILSS